MALLNRGRLFAGALFAGALFGGQLTSEQIPQGAHATADLEAQVRKHYELIDLKRDLEAKRKESVDSVDTSAERVQKTAENVHIKPAKAKGKKAKLTVDLPAAQQMLVPGVESDATAEMERAALEEQRKRNELALLMILSEV